MVNFIYGIDRWLATELQRRFQRQSNIRSTFAVSFNAHLPASAQLLVGMFRTREEVEWAVSQPVPAINCSGNYREYQPVGTHVVSNDDAAIGAKAARYFIQRGFRSLAVTQSGASPIYRERTRGFMAEAAAHQVKVVDLGLAYEMDIVRALKNVPRPCGLFVINQFAAGRAIDELEEAGLRVPDDVAILSTDVDEFSNHISHVTISSINTDVEAMAEGIVRLIPEALKDPGQPPRIENLAPGPLLERQSSLAIGVPDPAVRERFTAILATANDEPSLSLQELARRHGMSKPTLERLFRKHLGENPGKYLRRQRLRLAHELLTSGDETIEEIADRCGYSDRSNFHHAFVKAFGQSPAKVRANSNRSL